MPYALEEIRGAVARGWCHKDNQEKDFDAALAEAIAQEIWKLIHDMPTRSLP